MAVTVNPAMSATVLTLNDSDVHLISAVRPWRRRNCQLPLSPFDRSMAGYALMAVTVNHAVLPRSELIPASAAGGAVTDDLSRHRPHLDGPRIAVLAVTADTA